MHTVEYDQIEDVNATTRLMDQGQEIFELLQRAFKLGYTLTLGPDQMKVLIDVFENAKLTKPN